MSNSVKEFLDEWAKHAGNDMRPITNADREELTRQFQEHYGITLPPYFLLTGIQASDACVKIMNDQYQDAKMIDLTIAYGNTSPSDIGQEQAVGLKLPSVADLTWSEERPPDESCRYNHAVADTPFGRFLITWKGWKKYDCPTIDETPWQEFGGAFSAVDEAKAAAQAEFKRRILTCISKDTLETRR